MSETLTDEQEDILRELTAYRYPRFTIGLSPEFTVEVSAIAPNPNRRIWGPHTLGTGTFAEMRELHDEAKVEYHLLVKTETPQ